MAEVNTDCRTLGQVAWNRLVLDAEARAPSHQDPSGTGSQTMDIQLSDLETASQIQWVRSALMESAEPETVGGGERQPRLI